MCEVTYHTIVHGLKGRNQNAIIGLLLVMLQGLTLVLVFFVMFQLLGLRNSPIRGDFLLYIMSGIFVFLTHVTSVNAVFAAGNPTASMMLHGPMNTIVAIIAAALTTLYQQIFIVMIVLLVYHIAFTPITIDEPIAAAGMFILAWGSGCAVGLVFLAIAPWFPNLTTFLKTIYTRMNMIASGKMFVVNALPSTMIALFDWNPLFHIIDQIRGFVFLHYNPYATSISYPLYVTLVLIMIGLMGEFFTRERASISWSAGR